MALELVPFAAQAIHFKAQLRLALRALVLHPPAPWAGHRVHLRNGRGRLLAACAISANPVRIAGKVMEQGLSFGKQGLTLGIQDRVSCRGSLLRHRLRKEGKAHRQAAEDNKTPSHDITLFLRR